MLRGESLGSLVPHQFMRGLSLALVMRSFEFRPKLRLEVAACLFELSLSPCHASQQCVQLLWTQYQQSEHKHEQDLRSKTHASPPWPSLGLWQWRLWCRLASLHLSWLT